jgi:hypothetical protein
MLVGPRIFFIVERWRRGGYSFVRNVGAAVVILCCELLAPRRLFIVVKCWRGRGYSLLLNAGAAAVIPIC